VYFNELATRELFTMYRQKVLARLQSGPLLIADWNNDVLRLKAFDYFDRFAVELDLCVFVMVYQQRRFGWN